MFKKLISLSLIISAIQATNAVSLQPCDGGEPVEFSEVQLAQLQSQLINNLCEDAASMLDQSRTSAHAIISSKSWKDDETRTKALEKLEALKNFTAELETQNEAAIPVNIRRDTLALLRSLLLDAASSQQAPIFSTDHARHILAETTIEKFLPLLRALCFLDIKNEDICRVVAQHYFTIQPRISLDNLAQHMQSIILFFQQHCVRSILINAVPLCAFLHTLTGHKEWTRAMAFSSNGMQLATWAEDRTVKLWDTNTGKHLHTFTYNDEIDDRINSIKFSPDDTKLIAVPCIGAARLWNIDSGQYLPIMHEGLNHSVALLPDSTKLVARSNDHIVKLLDVNTDQCLRTFTGHTDRINSITLSPDSTKLATGSCDKTAKLWDVNTGTCLQTFTGHTDDINSVAFSPDGTRLATGSEDHTAKVWDIVTGQCLNTSPDHEHRINSVIYSPDGTILATVADEVRLWNIYSGQFLHVLSDNYIVRAAFFADGAGLITVSLDNVIRLWNAYTGKCLHTLPNHTSVMILSPDGTKMAAGSINYTVNVWGLLNTQQQLLLTWALQNPRKFRNGVSLFLDGIYASLSKRVQRKITARTLSACSVM